MTNFERRPVDYIRMVMMKAFTNISKKPISWLKVFIYAFIIFLVYHNVLYRMVILGWSQEDYSHCYIIPFIILYLIWEKRIILMATPNQATWKGLWPLLIGTVLFCLGELGGEYFTLYLSLWLLIVGIAWMHLGWKKFKIILFPFILIPSMFHIPSYASGKITLYLKLISSQLGVWMLHLYGMSAYREGNIIDLGFTQLQVVDACSGLRYVIPLAVLSFLLVYWFKAHWWKRVILFLSSIPLAIFVNSFRIAATGALYNMFGAEVAEGFFHGFSGWLIFMFAIPCLLLEMWVLRRIPPEEPLKVRGKRLKVDKDNVEARNDEIVYRHNNIKFIAEQLRTQNSQLTTHKSFQAALLQPKFIVAVIILLMMFGLSHGIEFRQKVPILKPFSQFPMQIGEWKGEREDMEQQFLNILKFSDYIIANYTDSEGRTVNFYVAYYQDQQKGESIHSPETCLPASGWEFKEAENVTIPAGVNKASMMVNRAFIVKENARELVYYWFPQRGRILTKNYQLKIYTFWDSLTRQRTDGALVRIITPISEKEKLDDAEQRLKKFVQLVLPVLDEFIPK